MQNPRDFTLLIVLLILSLIGDRFFKICVVFFAFFNFAKNIIHTETINKIKSFIKLYFRNTTITVKLKPHIKCYGINKSQPLCNEKLNSNDISLPHEANVLIRDGFTFKFVDSDDVITDNISVNNCDVYTLGPIKTYNYMDNEKSFSINPKTITVQKGTPYYDFANTYFTSYCNRYFYLSQGEIIMLPKGTLYNNGNYNEELSWDTKVIVA